MAGSEQGPPGERPHTQSAFDVIGFYLHPGRENVMLIYVLYLAGLVPAFGIVPIIVGFVMAIINRPNGTGIWASHYEFQYRTAAIGLLFVVCSAVLVLAFGLGVILLILTLVWWIVRSVKGLIAASHGEAIAQPQSWNW